MHKESVDENQRNQSRARSVEDEINCRSMDLLLTSLP
jgi:hypothetical protein